MAAGRADNAVPMNTFHPNDPDTTAVRRRGPAPLRRAIVSRWPLAGLAAFGGILPLLAACEPTFNWREIHSTNGYRVMFPAKPTQMKRRIDLDGLQVDMTMQVAEVETMSFAVGVVELPAARGDALAATRERALAAMRAQMVRNIHGQESKAREQAVALIDDAGQVVGKETGEQIEADGQLVDRRGTSHPVRMLARFAGHDGRAVQAVVLGHPLDGEQAGTFVESLRLMR